MTTLTTRPLPLLPLAIARSMTCNERSPSTGSPTPPSSLHIMHPDNILLQSHGITSPRLSSASSVGSALCGVYNKNCDSPPSSAFTVASENCDRGIRDIRNSPENHLDASETSDIYHQNTEDDNVTDRMSCCSEDSELSVGQEGCDNNDSEQNSNAAGKQVMDDSESVDNVSSLSDDNRLGSVGDQQCDDMSNDSSPNRDVDPIVMATAMRIPVPIVRPSPTRLQEEFLRKSHLYAEELMKQQMQFMAAARASAFSLRHPAISPEAGKVGFRPHIKQPEINDGLTNFSGIHSHLNAISKISSQLTSGESALSKLAAFGVREQSQSPPSSNSLHPNVPLHPHHFMNNNLNESSLKFSIDNILKADFGRRITDPLLKRSGGAGGFSGKGLGNRKASSRAADRTTDKHVTPIDLTSVVQQPALSASSNGSSDGIDKLQRHPAVKSPAAAAPSSTPSSSTTSQSSTTSPASSTPATATSSESSSSGGSGGPMVWPAWVYCTRYSDRPSSGRSPRTRKPKKPPSEKGGSSSDEKRPRTAFSGPQLARLKHEFSENRYLTERRRQQLSAELGLNEAQIKIWFQNKRAKIKKASGTKNPLALQLMAQGLYNHSTVPLTREEEELQELQAKGAA